MNGTMFRPAPLSMRSQISSARSNQPRCASARARSESSWAWTVSENSRPATKADAVESFAVMRIAPGKGEIRPEGRNQILTAPDPSNEELLGLVSTAGSAEHVGVPVVDLQRERIDRDRVHPAAFRAPPLIVRVPRTVLAAV